MASPLSKPEVVLVDLVPEESTSRTVYPSVRMMSLAVGGRYDESDTDFSRTQPNLARRVGKGTPFSTSKQVDVGPFLRVGTIGLTGFTMYIFRHTSLPPTSPISARDARIFNLIEYRNSH